MPLSTIFQLLLWRSVLLVEETGVPGESHLLIASHWQTLSHDVVLNIDQSLSRLRLAWFMVMLVVLKVCFQYYPCYTLQNLLGDRLENKDVLDPQRYENTDLIIPFHVAKNRIDDLWAEKFIVLSIINYIFLYGYQFYRHVMSCCW